MKFIQFKNIISSKGVMLFDADYRIAHYTFINLNTILKEQTGGSVSHKKIDLINLNNVQTDIFVRSLLTSNYNRIKYMINNYNK